MVQLFVLYVGIFFFRSGGMICKKRTQAWAELCQAQNERMKITSDGYLKPKYLSILRERSSII